MFRFLGRLMNSGRASDPDTQDTYAFDPEESDGDYQIQTVSLEGDPEEIAEQLLAPHLPSTFLDEVDISTEQGQAQLFAQLITRRGRASIEKDEIIRFVEKNRDHLEFFVNDVFPSIAEAGKRVEDGEELSEYFDYIGTQLRHGYNDEYDKIDVRSDRLFWLIYALSSQLSSGNISYDDALEYLRKPEHRQRISPHQLQYMLFDFADSIGSPNQPSAEIVILIGEAAQLISEESAAHAAFDIVLKLGEYKNPDNTLRFLEGSHTYLSPRVEISQKDLALFEQMRQRFAPNVPRDDF